MDLRQAISKHSPAVSVTKEKKTKKLTISARNDLASSPKELLHSHQLYQRRRASSIKQIALELRQRRRNIHAPQETQTRHARDSRRDVRHGPSTMREDHVDLRIVCSLARQQHVLHGAHRLEGVLGHGIRMAESGAGTAGCYGVDEDGCGAFVEEAEDGIQRTVAQVRAVCVGVHTNPIKLQHVEAELFFALAILFRRDMETETRDLLLFRQATLGCLVVAGYTLRPAWWGMPACNCTWPD